MHMCTDACAHMHISNNVVEYACVLIYAYNIFHALTETNIYNATVL